LRTLCGSVGCALAVWISAAMAAHAQEAGTALQTLDPAQVAQRSCNGPSYQPFFTYPPTSATASFASSALR
jgi:hypothetical protein